jgi:hypothetical protein
MKFLFTTLILLIIPMGLYADWNSARSLYETSKLNELEKTRKIVLELTSSGLYFSAVPWMKEFITSTSRPLDGQLEKAFDKILTNVGTAQFEILPIHFLERSSSPSIRYLIAKKFLKQDKYNQAIQYVAKINANHPVYPFAAHLLAVAYSAEGNQKLAVSNFKDCEKMSQSRINKTKSEIEKRQLMTNRDYCIMGIARSHFTAKEYKVADLKYLDIPKSSFVWPEVLFEEAWNSYYLNNFNRTLGKLVTYKAPIFHYVFNPEIEVLNALTYLKLCLYADASKIAEEFYKKYMEPTRELRLYLKSKSNLDYFYRMVIDFESSKRASMPLVEEMLKDIVREGTYLEMKQALINLGNEIKKVSSLPNSKFKAEVLNNLKDVLATQKNIIGSHTRTRLVGKYADLYRAFEGMSYIRLEVLAQKKARLYNFDDKTRSRGDVKYIERNDKQYFWDFNGEFWADELGDYVFALGSEC